MIYEESCFFFLLGESLPGCLYTLFSCNLKEFTAKENTLCFAQARFSSLCSGTDSLTFLLFLIFLSFSALEHVTDEKLEFVESPAAAKKY